jgi:UDP-N-acetyl-alpha-D-muramoyl-L-alanyl-L-glutamate epimerase
MATSAREPEIRFDPGAFETFRFVDREIDECGRVVLRYALDHELEFVEEYDLAPPAMLTSADRERVDGLLSLLHWVAGVSYFKTAAPAAVDCGMSPPSPATALLLEALYSEGLGEFAYENRLAKLPRPVFPRQAVTPDPPMESSPGEPSRRPGRPNRILVPIGGGKDSIVALEAVRGSGCELALFSVGNAPPIARTAAIAGLPHLLATRRLDPSLPGLNRGGALNGHVPITAIVSCVALLTAALHGFDAVALANERSASNGNVQWDGIDVNHQFSKSLRAERLLRGALAEKMPGLELFSVLRAASELAVARAFARMEEYHQAFTSCNTIFRLDPALRRTSWCCDCPKCRFVFLVLAPFCEPAHLRSLFGHDLLDDESQFAGFALLTATGGHKPFECVGEEEESLAAIRMLAQQPRWSEHRVVRKLVAEVLPRYPPDVGVPERVLALSDEHFVPNYLLRDVAALLRS